MISKSRSNHPMMRTSLEVGAGVVEGGVEEVVEGEGAAVGEVVAGAGGEEVPPYRLHRHPPRCHPSSPQLCPLPLPPHQTRRYCLLLPAPPFLQPHLPKGTPLRDREHMLWLYPGKSHRTCWIPAGSRGEW